MLKTIAVIFAILVLGISEAYSAEVSFNRESSNPLFKICSPEKEGSSDNFDCRKKYTKIAIQECYAKTPVLNPLYKCIGKGRSLCRVVSKYVDTLSINFCGKLSLEVWESILEDEYSQFAIIIEKKDEERKLRGLKSSLAIQLTTSQQDWKQYRKSKCSLVKNSIIGTARVTYTYSCKIKMTAERAIYLREQREYS